MFFTAVGETEIGKSDRKERNSSSTETPHNAVQFAA